MEGYFQSGIITSAHGIKGDLKVFPTTDNPERFEGLNEVNLLSADKKKSERYKIQRVWYHNKFVMLKLDGVDSMSDAEKLKGYTIHVSEAEAIPLYEDEYYTRDLYDMEVFDDAGKYLGDIEDILSTGANDVYVIKNGESKELLIPAIKDCILSVDVKNKKMQVKLLEGLLEL